MRLIGTIKKKMKMTKLKEIGSYIVLFCLAIVLNLIELLGDKYAYVS